MKAPEGAVFYHGSGCDRCKDRGYLGRVAMIEALPVSESIRRLIIKRASSAVVKNQAVSGRDENSAHGRTSTRRSKESRRSRKSGA